MIRLSLCLMLTLALVACAPHKTDVLVFDYGSPSTPKIAKRLDALKVSHMVRKDRLTYEQVSDINPKVIIISGSPASVYEPNAPKPFPEVYDMGIPILGLCYGLQLMADQLGGQVKRCPVPEIATIMPVTFTGTSDLVPSNTKTMQAWLFHQDCVTKIPEGFEVIAHNQNGYVMMAQNADKQLYGTQFHPERFDKAPEATVILDRFVNIFARNVQ